MALGLVVWMITTRELKTHKYQHLFVDNIGLRLLSSQIVRSISLPRPARLLAVGAAALTILFAVPAGTPARAATTSPSYVEGDISNPVVGMPPVPRPDTPSCTVALAENFPSNDANGNPQNFSGTYTPPANCPGPWSKVVLDYTVSVSGRQYDRSASVTVGNSTIYFGTTMEPDPDGLTYHVEKDVTEYASLLKSSQPFSGGIGNYVSSTDNGVYVQTVTLTFYEANKANAAPREPDTIVGLGAPNVDASDNSATITVPSLPRNTVRAELEIYIKGNGCDEQWFASVPTDISNKYPGAFCPNGPYREVDASIDGIRAGAVQYFPYIYTGGIVPTLWRPIPAIGTFTMTPEVLDVTPLAADLDQAGGHTVTLSVPDANDVWNLAANLLLYTDSDASVITGGLTQDTVAAQATEAVQESQPSSTTVDATTTAARQSVLSGWVQTPAGKVTTTVTELSAFRNAEQATTNGLYEALQETDTGFNTTHTVGAGQNWMSMHRWSYPLNMVEDIGSYVDDNNYTFSGTVQMSRILTDSVHGQGIADTSSWSKDQMSSAGEQARSNGTLTEADGHSTETWIGSYEGGVWQHQLASDHGIITEDKSGFVH
jgi:hypothetical protein